MSLKPDLRLALLGCGLLSCGPDSSSTDANPVPDTPVPVETPESLPNVLIITLDTTRADVLSPYGGSPEVSPVASRLAGEGILFERASTVTPLTIPAHSSLFTGQYPPSHGVRDNGDFFLGESATTLAEHLKAAGYQTMASVGAEVTSHHWGFSQGFDVYFDDMGDARDRNRWRVERPGQAVVDDALSWLERQATASDPWLSWVHLFDAHHPYAPSEPFASRFPGQPYRAEVASADAQVGRLIDALEQSGMLDDTWVFMLADHGEGHGSHGEALHGVLLYDATTRIPLIIRPPDALAAGRRIEFPVSIIDIAPTVLSLVNVDRPEEMQGTDLLPWLQPDPASGEPPTREIYIESLYAWHHFGWAPQRAIVDNEHKLIDSTTPELFHRKDVRELQNLAEQDPQVTEALRQAIDTLQERLDARATSASQAALSEEQIMQLEALGYLTGMAEEQEGPVPFRGTLADPVTQLPVLNEVEQARKDLQAGDLESARRRVEQVLDKEPGLLNVKALLVQILIRQGEGTQALDLAREIHQERPSSSSRTSLGYLFLMQGRLDEAEEFFAQALETDPYLESCWKGYLHILFLRGVIPMLEAQLERAQVHLPQSPVIRGMNGVLMAMNGDFETAEAELIAALEDEHRQAFLNHGLGIIRRQQDRLADAEAFFLKELEVQPPAIPSRRLLVEIYATQGRYLDQLDQLEIIMSVEPPNALSAHSQAQALFNLKRYDESLTPIQSCRELAPEYPACAMLEANILKKLSRDEEAKAAYARALELKEAIEPPPTR